MKSFKVKHNNKVYLVRATDSISAVKKFRNSVIKDSAFGYGLLTNFDMWVNSLDDINTTNLVNYIKNAVKRDLNCDVAEIKTGSVPSGVPAFKFSFIGRYRNNKDSRWSDMSGSLYVNPSSSLEAKYFAQGQEKGLTKPDIQKQLKSEIANKLKQFADKTIYKDTSIKRDSKIKDKRKEDRFYTIGTKIKIGSNITTVVKVDDRYVYLKHPNGKTYAYDPYDLSENLKMSPQWSYVDSAIKDADIKAGQIYTLKNNLGKVKVLSVNKGTFGTDWVKLETQNAAREIHNEPLDYFKSIIQDKAVTDTNADVLAQNNFVKQRVDGDWTIYKYTGNNFDDAVFKVHSIGPSLIAFVSNGNKTITVRNKYLNDDASRISDDWSRGISVTVRVDTASLINAAKSNKIRIGSGYDSPEKLIGSTSLRFRLPNGDDTAYLDMDRNQSKIKYNLYDNDFTYKEFGGKSDVNKAKLTEGLKKLEQYVVNQLKSAGIRVNQSKVEVGGSSKFNSVWRQAQSYNDASRISDTLSNYRK